MSEHADYGAAVRADRPSGAVDELREVVEHAHTELDMLRDRLVTVMRPDQPSPDVPMLTEAPMTSIEEVVSRARALVGRIENTRARLVI